MNPRAPAQSKPAAPRRASPSEYSDAVSAAEMVSIRLIKSEFAVEPEGLGHDRSAWKRSYDCQVTRVSFDRTRRLLTGIVSADAVCKLGRRRLISLKSSYLLVYSVEGEPTDAAAESFVQRVGAFAAYPYFRAHFSDACSQAGVTLPPLPVLKAPPQRIAPSKKAAS